jgi:uncharacterized protein YeaO (DUF488 family)
VLLDRIWPRGMSRKNGARIDRWMKEMAPSDQLRKWFAHDYKRWVGFQKRYRQELETKASLIENLPELEKKHGTVTLIFQLAMSYTARRLCFAHFFKVPPEQLRARTCAKPYAVIETRNGTRSRICKSSSSLLQSASKSSLNPKSREFGLARSTACGPLRIGVFGTPPHLLISPLKKLFTQANDA